MRNLKRALSLVLAVVMVIGLMVVGASAVSYNDFSDREEIVNKDAVSMLTTLGIIEGKPDGSYAPGEGVDRAQMAKMISVIMNQGADNSALYVNSPSGLTDVDSHWAKGHINFCYTTGIIAGRGNGTFDPDAGVTAVEAAKMLLVAAGYDPKIEGLEGTDWALNTNALASRLGIFRNFTKDVSQPLNRDDAALLIYNALDVEMIEKYENGYALAYADSRTILSAMYGVYKVEGVVVGNKWAELDQTDSDAALKDGKTTLDNVILYSSTTANTTTGEGVRQPGQIQFNVDTPVEYLGKTVTLYIEKTTILSNSKVLGVATKDDQNVIQTTTATEDTVKDYLKGTGLSITDETEFYVNYGYYKTEADAEAMINNYVSSEKDGTSFNLNGISVEVIDNNNDGDVDYVLYLQETLSKITRYSEKNETLSFYTPTRDTKDLLNGKTETIAVDFADVVYPNEDTVTTDDLILYVQYGGHTYITVPEVVTGTMTRVDRDKDDELYITIDDGDTYKQSYILDAITMVDADMARFLIEDAKGDVGFDTKYDFILDSTGSYIVAFRPAEEVVTNYALVLDSAWTKNALDVKGQLKILKADGTEGTYYINWNASKKNAFGDNDADLRAYMGTEDVLGGFDTGAAAGTVITYTLSDDDMLTIKSVLSQHNLANSRDVTSKVSEGDFLADNKGDYRGNLNSGDVVYMEENAAANKLVFGDASGDPSSTPNTQYVLTGAYENGDGYLTVKATNDKDGAINDSGRVFAIDKNTVAFYYDVVEDKDLKKGGKYYETSYKEGDVLYGVATGWDKMSNVAEGTGAQVYPVLKKTEDKTYAATNLAEVVLFNARTSTNTQNWLLVLDANAVTSKILELNVVFEDGTTKSIDVSKDDYESEFDKPDGYAYMVAYTYSENADGTYDLNLNSRTAATTAELLKNGTLDVDNNKDNDYNYSGRVYPTLVGNSKVWDVTDASKAGDEVSKGDFVVGALKNAVIITTNDNKVLQTAWIWDYDDSKPSDDKDDPGDLRVDYDQKQVRVYNPDGATQLEIARAITNELRDAGFTNITVGNIYAGTGSLNLNADDMGDVFARDENSGLTVSIPVTQVYRVTYNGRYVGLFAQDEYAQLTSYKAGASFLECNAPGYTGVNGTDSRVIQSGNYWVLDIPADSGESYSSTSLAASANKTFAIVDAYQATAGTNVTVTVNGNGVPAGQVVAAGTEVTVSSSLTGSQQLTATEGTKTVEIGDAGSKPSTTYKVTANVTFNVKGMVSTPSGSELDEILKNDTEFNGIQNIVSTNVESTFDEDTNTIYLTSTTPMISFNTTDTPNSAEQAALDTYWFGNSGVSGGNSGVAVSTILSHYNTTKHPGQATPATEWAIVCVTVGNDSCYLGVGNGTATTQTGVSIGGNTYTIDFSGLTW